MNENSNLASKKIYFKHKVFVQRGKETSRYDVTIDPNNWEEMVNEGPNANLYFNSSLSDLVDDLSYLERENFIEYQVGLYEDPRMWLKELLVFLHDLVERTLLGQLKYAHYQVLIDKQMGDIQ